MNQLQYLLAQCGFAQHDLGKMLLKLIKYMGGKLPNAE
jgi:hypothetical protein